EQQSGYDADLRISRSSNERFHDGLHSWVIDPLEGSLKAQAQAQCKGARSRVVRVIDTQRRHAVLLCVRVDLGIVPFIRREYEEILRRQVYSSTSYVLSNVRRARSEEYTS